MDESLNRDLYEQIVRGIADGRKKTEADVRAPDRRGSVSARRRAARGPHRRCRVRRSGRRQAARRRVGRGTSTATTTRASALGVARLEPRPAHRGDLRRRRRSTAARAATIRSTAPVIGSDTLIDYIRQARRDSSIRAIVLRIDSPGGSAIASDAIWRELMIAQRGARRSADRRVDVRPGRVGRLLHRDAGARRSSRSRRR